MEYIECSLAARTASSFSFTHHALGRREDDRSTREAERERAEKVNSLEGNDEAHGKRGRHAIYTNTRRADGRADLVLRSLAFVEKAKSTCVSSITILYLVRTRSENEPPL